MKKIALLVVAVLVIGIVSLGALAYKGDPTVKGPNYNVEVQEQLEAAIEAGDYDAWIKVRQDNNLPMNGRMFQTLNKDNFAKFAEMHEANQAGDFEKAASIRAELGLGQDNRQQGNFQKGNGMKGSGQHNCIMQ